MENLADQLKAMKLKKVEANEIKDYSSPKTAGFMRKEDVDDYQSSVLEVNFEEWMDLLHNLTFPSQLLEITRKEAQLFVSIYEKLYANLDPKTISELNWEEQINSEEKSAIKSMEEKLQKVMDYFLKNADTVSVFVKLSSRSPKDAPMAQARFKSVYMRFLQQEPKRERETENVQISCILKAGFEALRVSSASEVIDMCIRSERVYQDLLLALAKVDRFRENWIVRKFVHIDVDMEFRGFVYNRQLTALSQYNYLIHSPRLVDQKHHYLKLIQNFFNENVMQRTKEFVPNYIIDFAICDNGECKK